MSRWKRGGESDDDDGYGSAIADGSDDEGLVVNGILLTLVVFPDVAAVNDEITAPVMTYPSCPAVGVYADDVSVIPFAPPIVKPPLT